MIIGYAIRRSDTGSFFKKYQMNFNLRNFEAVWTTPDEQRQVMYRTICIYDTYTEAEINALELCRHVDVGVVVSVEEVSITTGGLIMYTMKQSDANPEHWDIYDTDGDYLCTVTHQLDASALLSHLNKE
jgi:hypothetical protein